MKTSKLLVLVVSLVMFQPSRFGRLAGIDDFLISIGSFQWLPSFPWLRFVVLGVT